MDRHSALSAYQRLPAPIYIMLLYHAIGRAYFQL